LISVKADKRHAVKDVRMRFAIPLLLTALASNLASAQTVPGDREVGERLARSQCAECHAMPGAPTTAASGIPSFRAMAGDPRLTELALRAFLQLPHDRMPNIILSRQEIDHLVAYILSLTLPAMRP
jgi:mono/diheme cytochrome c family protein